MPHPNHLFVPRNPAGVHCVDRTMAAMEWDDLLCRYDGDRRAALLQRIPDGWELRPREPSAGMIEASWREAAVASPNAWRAMWDAASEEEGDDGTH